MTTRKNIIFIVRAIVVIIGIIFTSIHIYINIAREREEIMESYLNLNHTNESMRLSPAINEMIRNIENSQTLRSVEKDELLATIIFTARDMNMSVTNHVGSTEIADTAMSIVTFAGIYYNNRDIAPARAFEVLLSEERDTKFRDEYERIWRYLDGIAPGTDRADFENAIQQKLPGDLRIESHSLIVVEETIAMWLEENDNR